MSIKYELLTVICTLFVNILEEIANTFGMAVSLGMFYLGPAAGIAFMLYLLFTPYKPLIFLYYLWIYMDRNTPHVEGRRSKWVRNLRTFQYFRNYFPHYLVKTADLPTSENYILCVFPHGILCTGAFAHFTSDTSDFTKLYPGITMTMHTLNPNFYFPLSRDYILAMGLCSVSKEALTYQLTKIGKGRASVLVVGGSAEAMLSQPGVHKVVLKSRQGFAKLSITTGAHLVPIYIFGETDVYNQWIFPANSILHKLQQTIRRYTGVAPVVLYGRGFFQKRFGFLPFKKPVYTVVGNPIPVIQNENPSREEVEALHATFVQELTSLFNLHKYKYLKYPHSTFLSIED